MDGALSAVALCLAASLTLMSTTCRHAQVEKAVRLAQAALLAPPPDMAAAGPNEQLKFTRNVVVLEIRGAPVNLTLIDLPGIIQNVERPQDRPYRELVTSLVHEYIMRDNAIIVATISCKEDIETQVRSWATITLA